MCEICELPYGVHDLTGAQALDLVRRDVGPEACVEFERELCTHLCCPECGIAHPFFRSLGRVTLSDAECAQCGALCDPQLTHRLDGSEDYLELPLSALGLPPYDIFTGRQQMQMKHYLLAADRAAVLGSLA